MRYVNSNLTRVMQQAQSGTGIRVLTAAALMALYVATAVGIQVFATGAYRSELGAYSDEPAHYVTGVMIRDYAVSGFTERPLAFATEFYRRFPKVALGNWPPGFYVLQLPWLLAVGSSTTSALVLMSLLGAACAVVLALTIRSVLGVRLAAVVGLVFLFVPLTESLAGAVMTEIPLALVTVLAIRSWTKFLESDRLSEAWLFGVIVGFGLLIKGLVVGLLLMPILAWKRPNERAVVSSLLPRVVAIGIASALGVPWSIYFREQTRAGWVAKQPTLDYTIRAAAVYLGGIPHVLGWTITIGLLAWIVFGCLTRSKLCSLELAASSSAAGLLMVLLVVPASLEWRALLPAAAALLVVSTFGYVRALQHFSAGRHTPWIGAIIVALVFAELIAGQGLPVRSIQGYREALRQVRQRCDSTCVLLVISDPEGEGAITSEALAYRDDNAFRVVRGSKVLSTSDWAGRDYRLLVRSPEEFFAVLKRERVDFVLNDTAAPDVKEAEVAARALSRPEAAHLFTVPIHRYVDYPGRNHRRDIGELRAYRITWLLSPSHD